MSSAHNNHTLPPPRTRPCNSHTDNELTEWFAQYADSEGAVLLESSLAAYGRGGRVFAAVNPTDSWVIHHNQDLPEDWRSQLDSFLADETAFYALFFSYDFGAELLAGPSKRGPARDTPNREYKALALKYPTVKVFNSSVGSGSRPNVTVSRVKSRANVLLRPDKKKYLTDVSRIAERIFEGDIYQANLTTEWTVESTSAPWDVYRRLRVLNPCQYGGYANLGHYTILSSSPERLVTVKDGCIVANPIKGTITVGRDSSETERNIRALQDSAKDRAELLMIVDLLRNDLGRICATGSVKTPAIWRPEVYSSVVHLVAEITGTLRTDVTISEIIAATFPGGSITGAPKRRAVRILREIEGRRRGIYTGSFGFKYGSELDLNIAIRTLTCQESGIGSCKYHAQAGGGIVADSQPEAEYAEACLKARNLLKAIDMNLEPES